MLLILGALVLLLTARMFSVQFRVAYRSKCFESEEQRWQPLGDGRWGRVVGREGAER
jgi:hypothetical protein